MKIIVAGLPKTGTKSMATALRTLGYTVYDYLEHYEYLGKDWEKIFAGEGTTEDFRRMYENVDAVTDIPASAFWDEIHKAFPEAKIILTVRKDEEDWFKSLKHNMDEGHRRSSLIAYLMPSYYPFIRFVHNAGMIPFRQSLSKTVRYVWPQKLNKMVSLTQYRKHNCYVMQTAPKDKLLVYDIRQGWEPLCNFLGVEIPSQPFPHRNIKGSLLDEWEQATDPTMRRMKREFIAAISILAILFAVGSFKATGYNPFRKLYHSLGMFFRR